eukprot:c17649_g1_i1.p1 GENE.c17649_g1_i1~~c17649_g1_i1.p1  ORF type:complete len:487 (+),score=65.07 c17649_g1_i1:84-1544(+)
MLKKRFLADLEREKNPTLACKVSQTVPTSLPKSPHSPPPSSADIVNHQNLFPRVAIPVCSHAVLSPQRGNPVSVKQTPHPPSRPEKIMSPKISREPPKSDHSLLNGSPKPIDLDNDSSIKKFNEQGERLYCLCRKPYNPQAFMIGCDECDDWFHSRCVKIAPSAAKSLERYVCPRCTKKKSQMKRKAEAIADYGKDNKEVSKKSCPSPSRPISTLCPPQSASVDPPLSPFEPREPDSCDHLMNIPSSSERRDCDSSSSSDSPNAVDVAESKVNSPATPLVSSQELQRLSSFSSEVPYDKPVESSNQSISIVTSPRISMTAPPNQKPLASPDNFSRPSALSPTYNITSPFSPTITSIPLLDDIEIPLSDEVLLEDLRAQQTSVSNELDLIDQKTEVLKHAIKRAIEASQNSGQQWCGCPTDNSLFTSDPFCQIPAQNCVHHAHWQSLLKSDLVQDRIVHEKKLRRLRLEENVLRLKLEQSSSSSSSV